MTTNDHAPDPHDVRARAEEWEATHRLIKIALQLRDIGAVHDEAQIDAWLEAPNNVAFPTARRRA